MVGFEPRIAGDQGGCYITCTQVESTVNSLARLLCSPVLVPQMTGGTLPLGPVTEKVSVKHWVARLKAAVPVKRMLPFNDFETVVTTVVGPAITKELKSKRSWNKKNYIKKPTFLLIALFGPGQSAKNLKNVPVSRSFKSPGRCLCCSCTLALRRFLQLAGKM